MRPEKYRTSRLLHWFEKMRILTWERIARALGNPSRITVFRKLAQLEARSCYSHRGRYHTLDRLAARLGELQEDCQPILPSKPENLKFS